MKARVALLPFILLFCYGCAVIHSTAPANIESAERDRNKIIYYLPKGMIHIQQKPAIADKTPLELIVEVVYMSDPDKCYYIERCNNILYTDTLKIDTDKRGLLTLIDVTSESKVADIIMKVMETFKDVAKIFLSGGTIPQSARTVEEPEKKPFDIIIDPNEITECSPMLNGKIATMLQNIKDKKQINKELTAKKGNLEEKKGDEKSKAKQKVFAGQIEAIEAEIANRDADIKDLENKIPSLSGKCKLLSDIYTMYGIKIDLTPMATNLEVAKDSGESACEGVFYRPLLPYRLRLDYQAIIIDKVVYLPNKAPVISLDVKRGATGTRVTRLTFEEGLLTEVYMQRPSEALGLVSIPAGVVKSVAGLPLELLQFKVDTTTKSNDLLGLQAEQIKLQRELLEQQRKGINP